MYIYIYTHMYSGFPLYGVCFIVIGRPPTFRRGPETRSHFSRLLEQLPGTKIHEAPKWNSVEP